MFDGQAAGGFGFTLESLDDVIVVRGLTPHRDRLQGNRTAITRSSALYTTAHGTAPKL